MHRSLQFSVFLFLILAFGGCATVQTPSLLLINQANNKALVNYEFTGRIAVKQEEKGSYGNIRWMKRADYTEITLFSPLGQILAQLHNEPGKVTLILSDQRKFQADNGEILTRQVLGYAVPVQGMEYWLLGRAAAGTPAEQHFRRDGLMEKLRQDGWSIQYIDYTMKNGMTLPQHIILSRNDIEINLIIDRWIF